MRSIRVLAATALFAVSAVPLFASCTFSLTTTEINAPNGVIRLSWQPVAGATQYQVQSTFDDNFINTTTLTTLPATTNGVTVTQKTTRFLSGIGYRVIASNPDNPADVQCTGTTRYGSLTQETTLSRIVKKTVIPIVGSTPGANGAVFKTSLRLGPGAMQIGRIIFHPAGQPASASDPSIGYKVDGPQALVFDDVVAALGGSGIGSLDIVPGVFSDPELAVLPTEVRLFNDSAQGTFGSFESAVQPSDAFRPADWTLYVPGPNLRVNIGVRTLTAAHATFAHISATTGATSSKSLDLAADYVFMEAADQFFGEPMQRGDTIIIHFDGGDTIAIPFHTFTDNSTNDPAIFNVQSPARASYANVDVVSVMP